MSGDVRLLGVALAGGASRRYGSPKEEATLGGEPLLRRALRALAAATDAVGVVGGPASVPPGVEARADIRPGEGPLAGLETALAWARERAMAGVVILASDLPGVDAPAVRELVRRWRAGADRGPSRPPAVILADGSRPQPLAAVYGVEVLTPLSRWLDEGGRSAVAWAETLAGALRAPADELAASLGRDPAALLVNVNRPEDRVRAELLLGAEGPDREASTPPLVSVVGWKDAGKTTVAVRLVGALVARGVRVVALKHGHRFEVDTEGTDSWRLRHEAGAARVVLAGPEDHAVMGAWPPAGEPGLAELVHRYASDAELVVAEGWKGEPVPAVEVRRHATGRPPLLDPEAADAGRFVAVVTDEPGPPDAPPHLHPDAPDLGERLADLVLGRLLPDRAT